MDPRRGRLGALADRPPAGPPIACRDRGRPAARLGGGAGGAPRRSSSDGVHFAESRMAEHLGRPTLLLDITGGPGATARGISEAARELGCDAVAFIDVGGDVLAHGDEPGLASPLCDAIMLAAATKLDPELTAIARRLRPGLRRRAHSWRRCSSGSTTWGRRAPCSAPGPSPRAPASWSRRRPPPSRPRRACRRSAAPAASAARRRSAAAGGRSSSPRSGRSPSSSIPGRRSSPCAPLAHAVAPAASLDEAHDALASLGVSTELELERARARE